MRELPPSDTGSFARVAMGAALVMVALGADASRSQELQIADMGDCPLESGEVIQDCRIGYRTVGEMNQDRSNVILVPSWFGGTTEEILFLVGEDGFIDPDRYYVVLVDAFGNGVSSSPSNSTAQPGAQFPRFSIRDMARQQHRLLTVVLGIDHLLAVTGISMGGMQSFEWGVTYPNFAEKIMPIVGSPRLATYDIVLWETYRRVLEWSLECECQPPAAVASGMRFLMGGPDYQARMNPREKLEEVREGIESATIAAGQAHDRLSQLHAVIGHDVSGPYGGNMEAAAAHVKAEMLVVVGLTDHWVTPGPAIDFADMLGAPTLELGNDCGHAAYACAPATFNPRAAAFLGR